MGLTVKHTSAEIARAVMEGVAFSLYHAWTAMNSEGSIKPRRIVATGGGSQSALWLDILADVFGYPLIVGSDQGAARGAALLARDSIGGKQQDLLTSTFPMREPHMAFDYRELTQRYIWWAERLNGLWGAYPGLIF
jgi:sugar (pentulose or hexulose) kinase